MKQYEHKTRDYLADVFYMDKVRVLYDSYELNRDNGGRQYMQRYGCVSAEYFSKNWQVVKGVG